MNKTEPTPAASASRHTPEPWHLRGDVVLVSPRLQICQMDRGNKNPNTAQANAARIVACVNSLAGYNPEAVRDVVEALEQFSQCNFTEENCANLDIASKRIRNIARAALAKLKQPQP